MEIGYKQAIRITIREKSGRPIAVLTDSKIMTGSGYEVEIERPEVDYATLEDIEKIDSPDTAPAPDRRVPEVRSVQYQLPGNAGSVKARVPGNNDRFPREDSQGGIRKLLQREGGQTVMTYAKLKAEHRCVDCKIQLSASNKFTKCDHCREYDRLYKKRPKRRQPSAKPEGVLTISQVIALATERHVSYGEMVLILEKEENKA